jgi:hypothetical protein
MQKEKFVEALKSIGMKHERSLIEGPSRKIMFPKMTALTTRH